MKSLLESEKAILQKTIFLVYKNLNFINES